MATSRMLVWGGGGNPYLAPAILVPTSGQTSYITPVVSGAHKWERWLRHPYRLGDPQLLGRGQY